MPRSNGEINQNQAAARGIITEASPLNFPEGATLDEQNFVLRRDGSRHRRFGLGREEGGATQFVTGSDVVSVHAWFDANEVSKQDYVVIQVGGFLYIYDATTKPLSDGFVASTPILFWEGGKIETTTLGGDLLYTYGASRVARLSVDESGTFSQNLFFLKIRDLWGIDDGLGVDERDTSLTDAHAYNLCNQGWDFRSANDLRNGSDGPLTWPSNADLYTLGISPDVAKNFFDERFYVNPPYGNTPAPKGSAIVNPLSPAAGRRDRMLERGWDAYDDFSLYDDNTLQGASAIASYAGRIFYAGFGRANKRVNNTYPDLNTYIFFSQTIESNEDYSKCYQEADPTAEDGELVATDGGFITIPSVGQVLRLVSTGRSVLVISTEGIWEIYSSEAIFSPQNYQVNKVTNIGAVNKDSIVLAQDTVFYWSSYGIQVLTLEQVNQNYSSQNLIEQSIQTLYDDIPSTSKIDAVGFFDRFNKTLRWVYDSQARPNKYDTELVYDFRLQAWTKNKFSDRSDGCNVSGYIPLPDIIRETGTDTVVVGADTVVVGVNTVVVPSKVAVPADRTFKYLVKADETIEFAAFNNTNYEDWGETDAHAYALTGHYTGGDTVRSKQATYLTMHFNRTETGFTTDVDGNWIPENTSSCLTRIRWDWSDNVVAGKFTNEFEAYRILRPYFPDSVGDPFDNGYPVVTTKNRIRGRGKAMNMYFESAPGKDLDVLGWNFQIGANSKV